MSPSCSTLLARSQDGVEHALGFELDSSSFSAGGYAHGIVASTQNAVCLVLVVHTES